MGKYLHYFSTKADYIKKYFSDEYEKHWTSLTIPGYKSNYDRTKKKLALTPLTLVPLTNNSTTFTFAIMAGVNTNVLQSISYSTDGGETWTKTNNVDGTSVNITVTVTNKQPVMFIGEGDAISVSESVYSKITSNQNFAAFGNPLSLLSQRYRLNSLVNHPFALSHLFSTAGKLVYADDLILSAKKCGINCYSRMFENCYLLETFPELPAVSLANYCYYYMFQSCSKMVTPPVLSSTKLGTSCYAFMFTGCSGLTSIPELPAINLKAYCYQSMFENCTKLTNCTVNLPATTMATGSYSCMFRYCDNFTTVPELPAVTLANSCYDSMFRRTKITTLPILPATTLAQGCYALMFYDCKSLNPQSGYTLPAMTLAQSCYSQMFRGCTALTNAPILPATTVGNQSYQQMFYGCTSLVNAPALPATIGNTNCYNGMFYNCTSITTMPTINLTAMYNSALYEMMRGCTSLVNVPDILPWTTLVASCYRGLFYGCTSLAKAPKLPAKTLVNGCYYQMFYNCSNINNITALFTTNPNSVSNCNYQWVSGVSSTGTFTMRTSAEWDPDSYRGVSGVPENWTVNTIEPSMVSDPAGPTIITGAELEIDISLNSLIGPLTIAVNDPDNVFGGISSGTFNPNGDLIFEITCSDINTSHTATITFSSPGADNLVITLTNIASE